MREAEHFLPIPDGVSDVQAAGAILNYVTAWQMIHRVAKVSSGQTALVTGAAGGVGTAALQILRLAGVKTYGAASAKKHETVRKLGAIPIDYRAGPPRSSGARAGTTRRRLRVRRGRRRQHRAVHPRHPAAAGRSWATASWASKERPRRWRCSPTCWSGARLRRRRGAFYGITMLYRKNPKPLREDLPKIFALIAEKKLDPLVERDVAAARREAGDPDAGSGAVEGKIVLTGT